MDIKKVKNTFDVFWKKYKYAILILLIGAALMLMPSVQTGSKKESSTPVATISESSLQDELEDILSSVKGVGKVRVMLKEAMGAETIYQTNQDITVSDSGSDSRVEVITITDADRNEQGLVKQVNPPQYLGVIVLCEGADNPATKLAVTEAVSKITGLGADKIAVLKMK